MTHKIFIASDHRGFVTRQVLKGVFTTKGYEVIDLASDHYDGADDYPDFIENLCKEVISSKAMGILICGSGNGMARTANKIPGIYASLCWNVESAELARKDGDSNVLCLSAMLTTPDEAEKIVDKWLATPFSKAERHARRLDKVRKIEGKYLKKD